MPIVVVGVNHRCAPVALRERLAFRPEQIPAVLRTLREDVGLGEAVVLSTCNRVEIYAVVPELDGALDQLERFLGRHGRVAGTELCARLYRYTEPQSVAHLFRVTSGLDSMVLGEGEILYQVKRAYELAQRHGATGKLFHGLFQRALNAAKAVRTQTSIGRGGTSVGTVAVELAEKIFGELSTATVLLVGAGKIGELALRRLAKRGVQEVRIMNRSRERAALLAKRYAGIPVPLEQLGEQLLEADILITSTTAPRYLLSREDVVAAMPKRHHRPLCVVDLGVPRNIEPAVGSLENVYLFDIDDLQGLITSRHEERQQAAVEAEAILEEKVARFIAWRQEEGFPSSLSSSEPVAVR